MNDQMYDAAAILILGADDDGERSYWLRFFRAFAAATGDGEEAFWRILESKIDSATNQEISQILLKEAHRVKTLNQIVAAARSKGTRRGAGS